MGCSSDGEIMIGGGTGTDCFSEMEAVIGLGRMAADRTRGVYSFDDFLGD